MAHRRCKGLEIPSTCPLGTGTIGGYTADNHPTARTEGRYENCAASGDRERMRYRQEGVDGTGTTLRRGTGRDGTSRPTFRGHRSGTRGGAGLRPLRPQRDAAAGGLRCRFAVGAVVRPRRGAIGDGRPLRRAIQRPLRQPAGDVVRPPGAAARGSLADQRRALPPRRAQGWTAEEPPADRPRGERLSRLARYRDRPGAPRRDPGARWQRRESVARQGLQDHAGARALA